jgi:NAD+ diphosphatase
VNELSNQAHSFIIYLTEKGTKNCFIFQENSLLTPENMPDSLIHNLVDPRKLAELLGQFGDKADSFSVPSLDGSEAINVIMLNSPETPAGWKQITVRQALSLLAQGAAAQGAVAEGEETGKLLRAFHIAQWRRESRFCGCCGSKNIDADTELARLCPSCGHLEFPRIAPAVITIIINDKDEALLAHNKKFTSGMYSLIAGFNEAGESLEETVAREIMEEVSLEVKDIRYIKSQPWPFPHSLMTGFFARYAGGTIKPDGIEIEDAQWFSRDKLPPLPGHGSVSRYLIELWLNREIGR